MSREPEPDATPDDARRILRELAALTSKDAPPFALPPFRLTGEIAPMPRRTPGLFDDEPPTRKDE